MLVRQTEGKVRILRFLPDSRRLVVATEQPDQTMRFAILDTVTGDSIPLESPDLQNKYWPTRETSRGFDPLPKAFALHPSGEWLSVVWQGITDAFAVFATKDGSRRPLSVVGKVNRVEISPRGDRLLVDLSGYYSSVIAYDIGPEQLTFMWQKEMPGNFNLAGFLPDGERFVSIEETVRIRRVEDGRDLTPRDYIHKRNKLFGLDLAQVSRDGRYLSALGISNMYVVDLDPLSKPRRLKGSGKFGSFVSSAMHPSNGTMAVIHSGPKLLKIYPLATLEQVQIYKWNLGPLCTVDFSPDGMTGAVGSEDGRILIWDVE